MSSIACEQCGHVVPAGSRFCNQCGARLDVEPAAAPDPLKQALDARAEQIADRVKTAMAVLEDDGAPAFDKAAVSLGFRTFQLATVRAEGPWTDEQAFSNPLAVVDAWPERTPPVLHGGLVLTSRLPEPLRGLHRTVVAEMRGAMAAKLDAVLAAARARADALLVDGQSQAQLQRITREAAMAQAEDAHARFAAGDRVHATAEFERLSRLAPGEAYFWGMLGALYHFEGRYLDALGAVVLAHRLAPDTYNTHNLLLTALALGLGPLALDLVHRLRSMPARSESDHRNRDAWPRFRRLARLQTMIAANLLLGVTPEEVDPSAPVLKLSDLPPLSAEWLQGELPTESAPPPALEGRVFVSYRRADTGAVARSFRDQLAALTGLEVFLDETELGPGSDLQPVIRRALDQATWVIALVGPRWATKRLDDPEDYVRRELERALVHEKTVVVVLVDGAELPTRALPAPLRGLADRVFVPWTSSKGPWGVVEALGRTHRPLDIDDLVDMDEDVLRPELERYLGLYVPRTAASGTGTPMSRVVVPGRWTIQMKQPSGVTLTLRIDVRDGPGSPFTGKLVTPPPFGLGQSTSEPIEGRWARVIDVDKQLFLGLLLDGVRGAAAFSQEIPMTRLVGNVFHGVSEDGTQWAARNREPRRL